VVRSDGCVMSWRSGRDAEASTSRAAPPASDATTTQLEQGLRCLGVPQTLLDEAQAEQALCRSSVLTKVLRLHGGRLFQLFEVRIFA
jgi:hypothetical protein